jgi:type I restriction-modification system DNA methylase subunit
LAGDSRFCGNDVVFLTFGTASFFMPEKQRIKNVGEVFTPQNIVNDMVDLIPNLTIETTILEPSVGEGVFLCEILRRKLQTAVGTKYFSPLQTVQIALQTLYGVDIMLEFISYGLSSLRA